jgi:hypothetical protein
MSAPNRPRSWTKLYRATPILAKDVELNGDQFPIAPKEALFIGRRNEHAHEREPLFWRFNPFLEGGTPESLDDGPTFSIGF